LLTLVIQQQRCWRYCSCLLLLLLVFLSCGCCCCIFLSCLHREIVVVVTTAASESIAFVVVVVVVIFANTSPSSSPAASPSSPLLSLLPTSRGNAQKYSAIQLNTTVQLYYLMYCCSTYWIQYSSDLPFNLILPSFSQFMDLSLGIKIFPHNKTSIFS
jgi:hypothetical protein